MKIIQVADLHINSEMEIEKIQNKMDELFKSLKTEIEENEEIIFCVCGDVVDKGNEAMYSVAESIFNYIKNLFVEYNFKFEFVPGNHDLCNMTFEPYDKFIAKFVEAPYSYSGENSHLRKYENIDLILSNSAYHGDNCFGKLDLKSIEQIESTKPSLLAIHHTLLSENNDDTSALRNAYKLADYIDKNNVIGILHGHTHGYKNIMIGRQCKIIGVGPMFKEVPDINNQFNFIEVSGSIISKISNYRYSADFDCYTSYLVYDNKGMWQYSDSSVKKIYDRVVFDVKRLDYIYNLKMNIATKYRLFEDEIREFFPDSIDKAKDWQAKKVPDSLYYNHGKYMQTENGIWGIDHIIGELNNKATSSRAIIPLISFENVVGSEDKYLPSLNIIQFGFSDDKKSKIFVTIYLRALEVNHFLKINLCEIYLLIKAVADEIRSIEEVDITVLAFKAQYKEKYGCFKKARIDTIDESALAISFSDKEYEEIINLLEEKVELSETVIEDKGIKSLKRAIKELVGKKRCSSSLLDKVNNTLEQMGSLKKEREKSSNYKEIERIEQLVIDSIKELIVEIKRESKK